MTNHFFKKIIFASLLITGGLVVAFHMSSCQKTDITPPYIFFDTATNYIGKDTAIAHGTIFTIWVISEPAGSDQLLTTGTISRRVNGGVDSVIQTMNIATKEFSQYYSYVAGKSGNKETYIFTFGQLDGLSASDSVTVTDL